MKYRLEVAGETVELDMTTSDDPDHIQVAADGKPHSVRFRAVSGNHFRLFVDHRITDAYVARVERGKYIFLHGQTFLVQDAHKHSMGKRRRRGPDDTPGDVTPPMPSVVVRILVDEGDHVKKGQGLIVVTAMKMETTLRAPTSGKVKKINTSVDAKVVPGEILVEIEDEVQGDE